tara:strand:+ start:8063 stop:9520 length:1458 start_codon:yes stop_codon:yes gene_type:complete
MPPRKERCPNGQRRNPKTGKCEKINKTVNKDPNCRACMMVGPGRRPAHICVRNQNGKIIKPKSKTPVFTNRVLNVMHTKRLGRPIYKKGIPKPKRPASLNVKTPGLSKRKKCMACVKYEPGLINPKTKVCEVLSKSDHEKLIPRITPNDIKELRKKAAIKGKMRMFLKKAVAKVRKPEDPASIHKIDIKDHPEDIVNKFQDIFFDKRVGGCVLKATKKHAGYYRYLLSKYRDVVYPMYTFIPLNIYRIEKVDANNKKTVSIEIPGITNGRERKIPWHIMDAKSRNCRFVVYIIGLNLYKSTNGVRDKDVKRHRNLIIFDLKHNYYYRYDPHGWEGTFSYKKFPNLESRIEDDISESFRYAELIERQKNNPNPKLISGFQDIPIMRESPMILVKHGVQHYNKAPAKRGKCMAWSLAYLHHRFHYPDKTEVRIDKMMGGGDTKTASEFIIKYTIFLMNNIHFHQYFDSAKRNVGNAIFNNNRINMYQ